MAVFSQASSTDEATKGLDLGADGLGMYRYVNKYLLIVSILSCLLSPIN